MEDSIIKIKFHGPFKLMATDSTSIFSKKVAFEKGIYLFTFPNKNLNYVYYVGMTATEFAKRLSQHLENYLIGGYNFHDPKFFVNGKNKEGFKGWMWLKTKTDGKTQEEGKKEYAERCEEGLGLKMLKFLENMQIYVAPLDKDQRTLERIEAEIALYLNEQLGLSGEQSEMVRNSQEKGVVYRPTREKEEAFTFIIENNEKFVGLKKQFEARWVEGRKSKLK